MNDHAVKSSLFPFPFVQNLFFAITTSIPSTFQNRLLITSNMGSVSTGCVNVMPTRPSVSLSMRINTTRSLSFIQKLSVKKGKRKQLKGFCKVIFMLSTFVRYCIDIAAIFDVKFKQSYFHKEEFFGIVLPKPILKDRTFFSVCCFSFLLLEIYCQASIISMRNVFANTPKFVFYFFCTI